MDTQTESVRLEATIPAALKHEIDEVVEAAHTVGVPLTLDEVVANALRDWLQQADDVRDVAGIPRTALWEADQDDEIPTTADEIGGRLTALASEAALARDWLRPEEDEAWRDLHPEFDGQQATGDRNLAASDQAEDEADRRRRQIEKNRAAMELLSAWLADDAHVAEQHENLVYLQRVLDEDRLSDRKLFP